jgi:HSP20 family protein
MTAVLKRNRKTNTGIKIFDQNITSGLSMSKLSPVINVGNDKKEYIIYLAVPGMERKDFSVTIKNKKLTVSAAKTEALHCFSTLEQKGFSEWKQTFTLPEDADTVMTAAIYKNGELQIHIPKGRSNTTGSCVELFVY